jgi:hypothetical protein
MYAYGVFFERHGDKSRIDTVLTQQQVEAEFHEDDLTDEQYSAHMDLPFLVSIALTGLRLEFEDGIKSLERKAKRGKPIVIDGEEWLFAIAATKKEAKNRFLKAYAKEVLAELDD